MAHMDVSKNRGGFCKPPKMDGEDNGKPYEQMGDFWGYTYFWKHPYLRSLVCF